MVDASGDYLLWLHRPHAHRAACRLLLPVNKCNIRIYPLGWPGRFRAAHPQYV